MCTSAPNRFHFDIKRNYHLLDESTSSIIGKEMLKNKYGSVFNGLKPEKLRPYSYVI